jgi:hypothetical protein
MGREGSREWEKGGIDLYSYAHTVIAKLKSWFNKVMKPICENKHTYNVTFKGCFVQGYSIYPCSQIQKKVNAIISSVKTCKVESCNSSICPQVQHFMQSAEIKMQEGLSSFLLVYCMLLS